MHIPNENENHDGEETLNFKLDKDLLKAAKTLTPNQARYLCDTYLQMQLQRLRSEGQVRSIIRASNGEPHACLDWFVQKNSQLENQIKGALDTYSKSTPVGRWSREVHGIGPVTGAGLLAYIDIGKIQTVGAIWRFAGLDPTLEWAKGQKRPFNANLKRLCYHIGESFVKFSNSDKCRYGHLWRQRKALETANNDAGTYAQQATKSAQRVGKTTESFAWNTGCYPAGAFGKWAALADEKARKKFLETVKGERGSGQPMLSPLHIYNRSRRWIVKLFLSHWFEVAWRDRYQTEPPKPYPIAILGHAHELKAIKDERTKNAERTTHAERTNPPE